MNSIEMMSEARERLADAVRGNHTETPIEPPSPMSPWLAASLLQKSIRRGRTDLALTAAATLLRDAPDRLWRRLGIVAFEDVGVADLGTIQLAMAATSSKSLRAKLGGEWAVATTLITRMTAVPKCRAADDLIMVVQHHPGLHEARHELVELPTRDLLDIATSRTPLPLRALALWLAIGTVRCPSDHLSRRRGDPDAVLDALCDAGIPDSMVETAREGLRRTGQMLCPFVSLLAPVRLRETAWVIDDPLPPEIIVRGVPGWAYDMFVREGRQAMKVFLGGESDTARWIRQHVPPPERINLFGNILFAIEGGLLRSRLDWPAGSSLRRMAEHESQGVRCPDGGALIAMMRPEMLMLNKVRASVTATN